MTDLRQLPAPGSHRPVASVAGKLGGLALSCWLALSACGGNYSNEDVDFQLAVPEREDLIARLPGQALTSADSAEYLLQTRDVTNSFNAVIDHLTQLVDHVRSHPPSARQGETRVWGPFPHERDPRWEVRMRMGRAADPSSGSGLRFTYAIEFHRVGATEAQFFPLLVGWYAPGGGARRGKGELELLINPARQAGYPHAEFRDLATLQVRYQRANAPYTVEMQLQYVAESNTPSASYSYSEEADRSGTMSFVWRRREGARIQAFSVRSRWLATGAGRADAYLEGLIGGLPIGADCWMPDGRSTYSRRDYEPRRLEGAPETCVFPAP